MYSKLLAEHGLVSFIAGSDYNFRYQNVGEKIMDEVERVFNEMKISPKVIYSGKQTHGKKTAYCDGQNGDAFVVGRVFSDTDGLITDKNEIALLIKFADCTPIVLFDPVKGVHASVHSGWRGTLQRISIETIEKMEREFGSKREQMLVFIGPSIDQDNYEVGAEVYEAFEHFENRNQFFKPHGEKFLLSMIDANLLILRESGIKASQIDVCRESTYNSERLHSARKEGKNYQLNGIITMMM